jgi:hypothetical protein
MNGGVIEGNEIRTQGHTSNSEVFRAKKLKTGFRRDNFLSLYIYIGSTNKVEKQRPLEKETATRGIKERRGLADATE